MAGRVLHRTASGGRARWASWADAAPSGRYGASTSHTRRRMTLSATAWPPLPYEAWRESKATLHMFTQVLGKLRLARSPVEPEWQHVPLYVTASGLTTGPVPAGDRSFEAAVDLLGHRFTVRTSTGDVVGFGLVGCSVARFYEQVLEALDHL